MEQTTIALPKIISNSIYHNKTLLQDDNIMPCDNEYLITLLNDCYELFTLGTEEDGLEIKNVLSVLVTKCRKLESKVIEGLENLCIKITTTEFDIPSDTIDFSCMFSDTIEVEDDMLFDNKNSVSEQELNDLTYKFYMLNCLITGCSFFKAYNILDKYKQDLDKLNPELYTLYKKLLKVYVKYIYNTTQKELDKETDLVLYDDRVTLLGDEFTPKVECEGVVFPFVVCSCFRGLLELAITNGLLDDISIAKQILSKTNRFKTRAWQFRLGLPFWVCFDKILQEEPLKENQYGLNFFLAYLSFMKLSEFSMLLKHVVDNDGVAKEQINGILTTISVAKNPQTSQVYMKPIRDLMLINDAKK